MCVAWVLISHGDGMCVVWVLITTGDGVLVGLVLIRSCAGMCVVRVLICHGDGICVLGGCCSATQSGFVCAVGADQATLVLNDCSAAKGAILDA